MARNDTPPDDPSLDDSNGFMAPEPDPTAEDEGPALSPTLEALEASRRPKDRTVCETCPASLWFASPKEVKCYCRVMHLIVWSTKEQNQLTHCDGMVLAQETGEV